MWKKALARFLWFQPGHIRRSESPRASGLGARRQPAQHRALRMKTERPGSQQQEGEGRRFNSFSPSWKTNQKDGGRGGRAGGEEKQAANLQVGNKTERRAENGESISTGRFTGVFPHCLPLLYRQAPTTSFLGFLSALAFFSTTHKWFKEAPSCYFLLPPLTEDSFG